MTLKNFDTILLAAQEKADWAWELIYRDLAPGILRYIRGLGYISSPEDVMGEVFTDIVSNIKSFSGDYSSFRSWVFSIAHNNSVEYYRKNKKSFFELKERAVEDKKIREIEEESYIKQLLSLLPEKQREVILLRVVLEFSIVETSKILSLPQNNVKSLQYRGLKRIRKNIEKDATFSNSKAITFLKEDEG